jgi:hypothetical protein
MPIIAHGTFRIVIFLKSVFSISSSFWVYNVTLLIDYSRKLGLCYTFITFFFCIEKHIKEALYKSPRFN